MSSFFENLAASEAASKNLNEAFVNMSASAKKSYVAKLVEEALFVKEYATKNSSRNGVVQGSAFLWVDLYGKNALDKAFRAYVKKSGKLFSNYRGSKNAWYFGSQSNVGIYDGLCEMVSFLNKNGISSSQCDEWD